MNRTLVNSEVKRGAPERATHSLRPASCSMSSLAAVEQAGICSGLAACHLETLTVMPGDKEPSPTLKAVPSCDIS